MPSVALCSTCGIVAPKTGSSCVVCKKPFDRPPRTVSSGDTFWVALRCTFPCRACGFASPLEGIELDTSVHCAQCGSLQRFDTSDWKEALAFAHEVGDLAGPKPEGRFPHPQLWIGDDNPHRAVGDSITFGTCNAGAMSVEASPGFPSCTRCRTTLEISPEPNGIVTRCRGCGAQGRYALPGEAAGHSEFLRGVVSAEQRVDHQRVRVEQAQGGIVGLLCPRCGAGIKPSSSAVVECPYCHVAALLPARARTRSENGIVETPIFWVLFQGRSKKRVELETPRAPSDKENALAKTAGVFKRGLSPLPGIELAPVRPGLDGKQLALTIGLTAISIAIGAAIVFVDYLM